MYCSYFDWAWQINIFALWILIFIKQNLKFYSKYAKSCRIHLFCITRIQIESKWFSMSLQSMVDFRCLCKVWLISIHKNEKKCVSVDLSCSILLKVEKTRSTTKKELVCAMWRAFIQYMYQRRLWFQDSCILRTDWPIYILTLHNNFHVNLRFYNNLHEPTQLALIWLIKWIQHMIGSLL